MIQCCVDLSKGDFTVSVLTSKPRPPIMNGGVFNVYSTLESCDISLKVPEFSVP